VGGFLVTLMYAVPRGELDHPILLATPLMASATSLVTALMMEDEVVYFCTPTFRRGGERGGESAFDARHVIFDETFYKVEVDGCHGDSY
jgi:hypothetical protein